MRYVIEMRRSRDEWTRLHHESYADESTANSRADDLARMTGMRRSRFRVVTPAMTKAIKTWWDLRAYLTSLPTELLRQPIQVVPPDADHDRPVALLPAVCMATVDELDRPTRSAFDNAHRPDSLVMVVDGNGFDEDGSIGEDAITGERIFPAEGGRAGGGAES